MDGVQSAETEGVMGGGHRDEKQSGKLCNSDLMTHKKVPRGFDGGVHICEKNKQTRRAYSCKISRFPSCSP